MRDLGRSRVLTVLLQRSSTMGSIALAEKNKDLPVHGYQISKAAVNMLNAQYAHEHADEGFTFMLISPGVS